MCTRPRILLGDTPHMAQARRNAREDYMASVAHYRLRRWLETTAEFRPSHIEEQGWEHRGTTMGALCRASGWSFKGVIQMNPFGVDGGPMTVFAWAFCRDCRRWSWHGVTSAESFQLLSMGKPFCEACAHDHRQNDTHE